MYPLFFPHSTLGWGVIGSQLDVEDAGMDGVAQDIAIDADNCGRQIMFYRTRILHEHHFRIFGKLTNKYAVDMLT